MRLRYAAIAVLALGCGGSGGDAYSTGPEGTGTGPGTGPGTGAGSASATVTMRQSDDGYGTAVFSFSPAAVAITVGGTVTWSNEGGGVAHNVTFSPASGVPANVPNLTSGNASRTFPTAGSYAYQCTNHTGMTGQVNVR